MDSKYNNYTKFSWTWQSDGSAIISTLPREYEGITVRLTIEDLGEQEIGCFGWHRDENLKLVNGHYRAVKRAQKLTVTAEYGGRTASEEYIREEHIGEEHAEFVCTGMTNLVFDPMDVVKH